MSDFGTMQDRIQSELHRGTADDTATKDAIVSAIEHYKSERFWFNQSWMEFTTTQGTDTYSDGDFTEDDAITNLPWDEIMVIDHLMYNVGTSWRYQMWRIPGEYIEAEKVSTTHQGYPDIYSVTANVLRVYPIPNTTGHKVEGPILRDINQVTAASADAATNAWFAHAEELIRSRAKSDLALNFYRDPEGHALYRGWEMQALTNLKNDSYSRVSENEQIISTYY